MPDRTYAIGELATAAGVAASAIRYYERRKLLRPTARSASGYRVYEQAMLDRLRFIRTAAATGLSLDDIAALLADGPRRSCVSVRELIGRRLAQTRQRMSDLRAVERALKAALADCCQGEDAGICGEVGRLKEPQRTA
jgi:DNA-binding transcriptional MerR regulator